MEEEEEVVEGGGSATAMNKMATVGRISSLGGPGSGLVSSSSWARPSAISQFCIIC